MRIGEYYKNGTHPQLAGSIDPIVLACQKNWHMFFTDGYTNQSGLPTTVYGDQDDIVPALPVAVAGLTTGSPWPPPYRQDPLGAASNSLSDFATYYWVTDLRTSGAQAANNVSASTKDPAQLAAPEFCGDRARYLGQAAGRQPGGHRVAADCGSAAVAEAHSDRVQAGQFGCRRPVARRHQRARAIRQRAVGRRSEAGHRSGAGGHRQSCREFARGSRRSRTSTSARPPISSISVSFEPSWGGGLRKLQIEPGHRPGCRRGMEGGDATRHAVAGDGD